MLQRYYHYIETHMTPRGRKDEPQVRTQKIVARESPDGEWVRYSDVNQLSSDSKEASQLQTHSRNEPPESTAPIDADLVLGPAKPQAQLQSGQSLLLEQANARMERARGLENVQEAHLLRTLGMGTSSKQS